MSATPPRIFATIITSNKSDCTRDWMIRNAVSSEGVESAAWRAFERTMLITIGLAILLILVFGTRTLVYTLLSAVLVPLLLANRVANSPSRQAKREQRAYLRESPETIGTLVMNMRIQPSLEWAVGRVSKTCSSELAKRFVRMGWEVLTRKSDSLDRALLAFIPRLSSDNDAVGRSLHLVLASTYEPDIESRDRVLDRANSTAIEGVKEAADHYVASLSNPALIIFALGIMLPVMLFSVAPLLSIGAIGSAGDAGSTFDGGWLFFLLLVVVPAGCLLFANGALNNNPLAEVPRFKIPVERVLLVPLGVSTALSLFFVISVQGEFLPYCLALSFILPTCAVIAMKTRDLRIGRRDGERAGFISALFQIGSRMAGGASFEKALEEIALNGKGTPFGGCADRVLKRARLDRVGLSEILERELSVHVGKDIVQAFVVVARASERDPHYAGKLALNLANNFSDIRAAEMKMEENLHGVVDMMRSTGMIFAPIVLGVTSSLMAITVGVGLTNTGTVDVQIMLAMFYLAELVFCVCYFTNFLRRDRTWGHLANDFAVRCPIALLVFTAVSLFARTGLSQLM
jgi:Flp pilus assembly protein TadB